MTDDKTEAALRTEAEERAHDRVTADATLHSIAARNLYVEALQAGARFAASRRTGDGR
jgi:hypothetical protein